MVFMKFDICVFFEKSVENIQVYHEDRVTFLSYLVQFFLE